MAQKTMTATQDYSKDFLVLDRNYESIRSYIKHISQGKLRSLIINGPPGVGKTVMTNQFLQENSTNYKSVTGHMTLMSLYAMLYEYRNPGDVLVLDDVDSVFSSIEGLNILKAAMDTTRQRHINWESSSTLLKNLGIPTSFDFNGGVVLITNVGFDATRGKAHVHLSALKDRSYWVRVSDGTQESRYKQVVYMTYKKGLLDSYGFTTKEQVHILDYIGEHIQDIPQLSLRTVIKCADIYQLEPNNFEELAQGAWQ